MAKILFAMCGRCAVKGDCLLFSLEVPVSGIRAGFHEEPRKRLRRNPKVIEWLKSTKPKGRKQAPPGQYGQARRA